MANQYVNLPAPAGGNGNGAAVDVSTFGGLKTIVVSGNARAQITIEINNDVVPSATWAPIASFQNTGQITLRVAARWMRMSVTGYNPYVGGTPVADVGGTDDGATFATLVAPAGDGSGAAVDVSALGLFKSIHVGDAFRGSLVIEVSEDGATEWAPLMGFQTPGVKSQIVAAQWMRVTRTGVPQVAPGLPVINIGATDDVSGDDGVAISAGTQSVATGTVVFSNSNGLSFGMSNSSVVTASMDAVRSIIGSGSTATGPSVSFANSNGVSFGVSGQTVTASVGTAAETPFGVSAGTQSVSTGTAIFSNSNNVSFGMDGSATITASASFPAETPFALSAGTQSVSTGTAIFSNANGISFGMDGSATITASYTQSTGVQAIGVNGAAAISAGTVVFSNSNNVTFGLAGSTVTASASSPAETPFGISAGTQSVSTGTLVFANSNNVSFGMSGSSQVTASYGLPPMQYWDNGFQYFPNEARTVSSAVNMSFQRVFIPRPISVTQVDLLGFVTCVASQNDSIGATVMVYTMTGSTMSSVSSATNSSSWASGTTNNTDNSSLYGAFSGTKWRSLIAGTWAMTPGEYMLGVLVTATGSVATTAAITLCGNTSQSVVTAAGTNAGLYSQYFAHGVYTVGTGAFPASVHLSDIEQVRAFPLRQPYLRLIGTF